MTDGIQPEPLSTVGHGSGGCGIGAAVVILLVMGVEASRGGPGRTEVATREIALSEHYRPRGACRPP